MIFGSLENTRWFRELNFRVQIGLYIISLPVVVRSPLEVVATKRNSLSFSFTFFGVIYYRFSYI